MKRLADGLEVGEKEESRMTKCFEQLGGRWCHVWEKEEIWGEKEIKN